MLTIPSVLTKDTDYGPLAEHKSRYGGDDVNLDSADLTDEMLVAIATECERVIANETTASKTGRLVAKTGRVIAAIQAARAGDFNVSVQSLAAFPEMLLAYLRANLADGWLYERDEDNHLHPWLVTSVKYDSGNARNDDKPSVSVSLVANGAFDNGLTLVRTSRHFDGESVARKRIADILLGANIFVETPAFREEYDRAMEHYEEVMATGFSEQFRYTGKPFRGDSYSSDRSPREHAKVIHDMERSKITSPAKYAESALFMDPNKVETGGKRPKQPKVIHDEDGDFAGVGPVPTRTILRVFDLGTHTFLWVNAVDMERYVYDKALGEKIVLPDDQRNLLDILTTNLDDFTGDVIEGKSAGNVVLCKGLPGVGKTLTAEVYAELIERPLYSIHSGNLGVNAKDVRENLEETFKRAKRWNCVLLLDEADVFVLERGGNITQNAIVAEFLRTLEYFDGLMFMTTNRADSIDDAILSRAAAIIDYKAPEGEDLRRLWQIQAVNQSGKRLDDALLDALITGFEGITGRDIKMLLRLALRVSAGNGTPLDTATFARCAMFRGLHFKGE